MSATTADRVNHVETRVSPPPVPPASRSRLIRVAVLLALLGGVAAFVVWRYEQVPSEGPAELALHGNVDVRQVNLSFKVGGRIKNVAVDEGHAVQAGQVLATLDDRYFEDELLLATAEKDQVAAALLKLENGSRPEEIAVGRAELAAQRATLKRTEQDLSRLERVGGTASALEYDQARAAVAESRARVLAAEESLRLIEAGPRREDIEAARAVVRAADARIVEIERKLADCRLIAPHDGIILTRVREDGAIVQSSEPVVSLTLTTPVWVRTYVDEPDLGLVQPGLPATVHTDSAPSHPYAGHIGFISPTAEFTPKTVETRELRAALVYRVRVVVQDPDGGLRQGMPITVRLQLPAPRPRTFWQRMSEALYLDRLGLMREDY